FCHGFGGGYKSSAKSGYWENGFFNFHENSLGDKVSQCSIQIAFKMIFIWKKLIYQIYSADFVIAIVTWFAIC
ncbi:MAG: hypothetical protein KAH62_04070, partial [Desulfobacula sp.]|nr:hypothetical protein [Desulfobacula sp.]